MRIRLFTTVTAFMFPITTNPRVRFMIDGRPFRLEAGQAYEINNQKVHSVMNKGKEDRITFYLRLRTTGRPCGYAVTRVASSLHRTGNKCPGLVY